MLYVTREDCIDLLSLSTRSRNCLRRADIHTVGQLLDYPAERLPDLKNMGKKSIEEIVDAIEQLNRGKGDRLIAFHPPAAKPEAQSKQKEPAPPKSRRYITLRGPFCLPAIPIEDLGLSVRAVNCLSKANVLTAFDLTGATEESLMSVQGLGEKTRDEILRRVEQLRENYKPDPSRLPPIAVHELGLSVRAVKRLCEANLLTAADLTDATRNSLMSVQGLGEKTRNDILDKVEQLREEYGYENDVIPEAPPKAAAEEASAWYRMAEQFSAFTGLPLGDLLRRLIAFCKDHPDADPAEASAFLCQDGPVRREVRRQILLLLERREEGITRQALLDRLPSGTNGETLDSLLSDLIGREQVVVQGELVVRRYPTVSEYVQQIADERRREILSARLRGETLEEVGQRYGMTRERVRQITIKLLDRRPRLQEDRYQYLFEHYDFSRKEFRLAFDEPEETYNYLDMLRTKRIQRRPLREILGDEKVSIAFRQKAERAVYRQYVTLEGVRVRKNRQELVNYTVRNYCQDSVGMEEFVQQYQLVLESLGLEKDASLALETRTYENHLNKSDYVLWSQWHRFRYYPIPERDCQPLLDTLDLGRYEDVELSSLKLFRDYPELMEEYDIRDEYELHNLLRKIWRPERDGLRVHFKRMPTIEIGTPDRDRQIKELLVQYAPISNTELAQRYEEAYGIKSVTALAYQFACIEPYLHNRIYRIDLPDLPQEQRERMAALLTGDFYRMADLRRMFQREFPQGDLDRLNPFSLKQLGFQVYVDYVVSTRFSSATSYFNHLLTGTDIVDMRETGWKFTHISTFGSELVRLKAQRAIIEFEPRQYIVFRRLQASGVTQEMLEDYCASVRASVRPGTCFTIASLRQNGFTHALDDLGFDDWFYGSVLVEDREHLSYQKIGGTRLFYRGRARIQMADFLRWLVEAEGRIDVYDLQEKLERQYGIVLPLYKLVEMVQSADLYYDAIMEAVYIDYDTYLEEI